MTPRILERPSSLLIGLLMTGHDPLVFLSDQVPLFGPGRGARRVANDVRVGKDVLDLSADQRHNARCTTALQGHDLVDQAGLVQQLLGVLEMHGHRHVLPSALFGQNLGDLGGLVPCSKTCAKGKVCRCVPWS